MHRQCLSHLHSCDHGERPTGSGGRPTDIREKTENSSERQQAIVLELALCMSKLQVLKKENKARQIRGYYSARMHRSCSQKPRKRHKNYKTKLGKRGM